MKTLAAFICILIALFSAPAARADLNYWTPANAPEGGVVFAVAYSRTNPQQVYAAVEKKGVFRSTDGGNSWQTAWSVTWWPVRAVAVDPADASIVYAGTLGVYKSTDYGQTWEEASDVGCWITSIAIDGSAVYAGSIDCGVFKSTNGGAGWTAVNTGLTDPDINTLAVDPVYNDTVYAGTAAGGFFTTTDAGSHWAAANNGLPSFNIHSIRVNTYLSTSRIWAGTDGHGVYCSTDGGGNWSACNGGMTAENVLSILPDQQVGSNTAYAAVEGKGVYKTTDSGADWSPSNAGLEVREVLDLAMPSNDSDTLLAASSGGVFKTGDAASAWSAASSGIVAGNVSAIVFEGPFSSTTYAATRGGGVFKSTNLGVTWAPARNGLLCANITSLVMDPNNSLVLYAGGACPDAVYKSTDGGTTWTFSGTGLDHVSALAIADGSTLYAGQDSLNVYKSTDAGGTWNSSATGITDPSISSLAVDPISHTTVYAGTIAALFQTTDAGATWSSVLTGQVSDVAAGSGAVYVAGPYGTAYRSTNSGATWEQLPFINGTRNISVNTSPVNPDYVFAGSPYGVWWSRDGGDTWDLSNNGLTDLNVTRVAIHPGDGVTTFAGTQSSGLFQRIYIQCKFFCDYFEDHDDSDWTKSGKGQWNPSWGNLLATTAKSATAVSPFFSAPSRRAVDANLQVRSEGARVSLFGWYAGKSQSVELRLMPDKHKILLKQRSGSLSAKAKYITDVEVNHLYFVRLVFDGDHFLVYLDNSPTPIITMAPAALPTGVAAFKVKSATKLEEEGMMADICIFGPPGR